MNGNEYYDQWQRLVPTARSLLTFSGEFSWDAFQRTGRTVESNTIYARIRVAERGNCEFGRLFRWYKQQRRRLRRFYAYSVPCSAALQYLAHQEVDLLEIGCGKAYWAHLLRCEGVDIVAADVVSPHQNRWVSGTRGFVSDIVIGASVRTLLEAYKDRAVMLQWIPRWPEAQYAFDVLQCYQGDHLFVVGEGIGGATACNAWFQAINAEWDCIARLPLPRFVAITDSLYHYVRKGCGRDACDNLPGCEALPLLRAVSSTPRNPLQ